MIETGMKRYRSATQYFTLCVSAPTHVLNTIMLEAYKKYAAHASHHVQACPPSSNCCFYAAVPQMPPVLTDRHGRCAKASQVHVTNHHQADQESAGAVLGVC